MRRRERWTQQQPISGSPRRRRGWHVKHLKACLQVILVAVNRSRRSITFTSWTFVQSCRPRYLLLPGPVRGRIHGGASVDGCVNVEDIDQGADGAEAPAARRRLISAAVCGSVVGNDTSSAACWCCWFSDLCRLQGAVKPPTAAC